MNQPLREEQEIYYPLPETITPGKRPRSGKSFNFSRSKLPILIGMLLLVYLVISFYGQFNRLYIMQKNVSDIQKQVQDLQQKNTSLREELRLVQSDAYIEKTAREKIGLIKPGETRVVAVPQGTEVKKIQPPAPDNTVAD